MIVALDSFSTSQHDLEHSVLDSFARKIKTLFENHRRQLKLELAGGLQKGDLDMPEYYSNWEEETFVCRHCAWRGKGIDCPQGEHFRDLVEMDCPKCHEPAFVLMFPTLKDMRDNWDSLEESDKSMYLLIQKHNQDFEDTSLKSTDQLPDLAGDDLVFTWDIEDRQTGGKTLIKHGDRVLWEETACFEGYERFEEVAAILKEKYQDQLLDLVPTRKSEMFLYGDRIGSTERIDSCRSMLAQYEDPAVMHRRKTGTIRSFQKRNK